MGRHWMLLFALLSLAVAHQCTFNHSGYFYDFSRMRELGDLVATTGRGNYYFQVCSEVVSHCGQAQSSVCLKAEGKTINEGSTDSAQWSIRDEGRAQAGEGVTIEYSNGDLCGSEKTERKTVVNLICQVDSSAVHPTKLGKREINVFGSNSKIESVDDSDDCTTLITVKTPFACAVNKIFSSDCRYRTTQEDCFTASSAADCHCSWCSGVCVPNYEKCSGMVEFGCRIQGTEGIAVGLLIGIVMIGISLVLLLCLCACACFKKRRNTKINRVKQMMQVHHPKTSSEEFAMEPFLQSEMPPMNQQVQFVYVQVPMMGTEQQNPPYFAPQPFYFAPQFIQPNENAQ